MPSYKNKVMANGKTYYYDRTVYHMGENRGGEISALCYKRPHAIPAEQHWTLNSDAVTCQRCREVMRLNARKAATQAECFP